MFNRFNILSLLCVAILFSACLKETDLYTLKEGVVYMPQAFQDKNQVRPLIKIDSVQETGFGFYYTSYDGAPTDITGTFVVDTTLIKKYNELNAFTGIVYQALPQSAYTISGLTATVKSGNESS